jgi:hypothetical protein
MSCSIFFNILNSIHNGCSQLPGSVQVSRCHSFPLTCYNSKVMKNYVFVTCFLLFTGGIMNLRLVFILSAWRIPYLEWSWSWELLTIKMAFYRPYTPSACALHRVHLIMGLRCKQNRKSKFSRCRATSHTMWRRKYFISRSTYKTRRRRRLFAQEFSWKKIRSRSEWKRSSSLFLISTEKYEHYTTLH